MNDSQAVVALTAAVIGVSGGVLAALIAAVIAYLGSVRGVRASYNLQAIEHEREYAGEAVSAAESQYVLLANLTADIDTTITKANAVVAAGRKPNTWHEHNPALIERLGAATADWRSVLARRNLYGHGDMGLALIAYDRKRADVIEAVNRADLANARHHLTALQAKALPVVHLAVSLTAARSNTLIASSLLVGRERRRAVKQHIRDAESLEQKLGDALKALEAGVASDGAANDATEAPE